ncbi:DUF3216 domain-containing protein [Thermococcus sp.]|uniref:DUF3216 domain-containing protein n=1 Tax=Thermococcus sp. TaxID=35749 RepID=UPI002603C6B8|nr:DUF3216 domain-containing protein [Thermococcus sp.]
MEVPEVEEVKALLERLGERELIGRVDSFVRMNEGLEAKRGEDFIAVSILGFLEGILTVLGERYPEDKDVRELHEKVRARRAELDEQFRRPRIPYLEEG